MIDLLKRGEKVSEMMQVTGEDGVTLDDFVTQQAALFLDMVYLQQDAFDEVDASTPLDRQKSQFDLVYAATTRSYAFDDKKAAREHFTRLSGLVKNLNYATEGSPEHGRLIKEIAELDRQVPIVSSILAQ